MTDKKSILNRVKCISDENIDDDKAGYCYDDAVSIIKGYCGIDEISDDMEMVLADIVFDLYREEVNGFGDVRSIKEGDVAIGFGDSGRYKNGFYLIKNYEKRLKPFRRVKWK